MKKKRAKVKFDMETARQMIDTFSSSCGAHCSLYSEDGEKLYEKGARGSGCEFCKKFAEKAGLSFKCESLHSFGAYQAERFGGRYIYFCPLGLSFSASPILAEGRFAGSLVAGPVLITDIDDFMENDVLRENELAPELLAYLRKSLQRVQRISPHNLGYLSRQLFADAVYISDSSHEIFLSLNENKQQNFIGDYISRLKEAAEIQSYPVEKEQALSAAVTKGDKATAGELLNQILGYIFFYISDPEESRVRVEELFVVLSRAAVYGGAAPEQIFRISQQYTQDLRALSTQEEFTRYLAKSLNRFTDLVFDMVDAKHSNVMHNAIAFIGANYARNLTLTEVAEHVGYSPAYFSRIFKEEMGNTFKEYLNELRVEKSKALLLGGHSSVAEVCHLVGFNDQSYFCKMFRAVTGVSPDKFRKRVRRIDTTKEYGG